MDSYVTLCMLNLHCVSLYAKTPYLMVILQKFTHFPIACMNYSYILLVSCAFIYVGVSVTRRVNVVIVNSRNMGFFFWIFSRQ